MCDSVWTNEEDSFLDTISNGSGFSLGEDCDHENDDWIRDMLITIDKLVLLDKNPPEKFPSYLLSECEAWNSKFRQKFSETERGAIFLRYSNNCVSQTLDRDSRGSFHSRGTTSSREYGSSTSSRSSSLTDMSGLTVLSRESSQDNFLAAHNSRSVILQPIESVCKKGSNRNVSLEIQRRPLQLPPLSTSDSQNSSSSASNSWIRSASNKKGFPNPPIFFSIDDLLPMKSPVNSGGKQSGVESRLIYLPSL